jgi:hypothetical protein
MKFREYWFPNALVGATGGAVGAMTLVFIRNGAKIESVITLLGALIGTSVAVFGAIYAADRAKKRGQAKEIEILRNDLNQLQCMVTSVSVQRQLDEQSDKARRFSREFCELVKTSVLIVEHAQARSKELDFIHLAALDKLLPELLYARQWCIDVQSEREDDPQDMRDWTSILKALKAAIGEALEKLHVR